MLIDLNRRAEIAFRSLNAVEQKQVSKVIERLASAGEQDWRQLGRANKLKVPGENDLYVIRASPQLRVIVKDLTVGLSVQDIVPYERLSRIVGSH